MRALSLPLFVLITACSAEKKPAASTPSAPAASTSAPVTLAELQNGDAACYVVATSAAGEPINYPGAFELCEGGPNDATPLIGKTVTLTIGRDRILAGSCEGDPECKDTEEVDFVTAITASP